MFMIGLLVGLLMLVVGAELLVRGGGQIALALRIPALVVGLTVVAFGTSTPELAVSVTAALAASTDMALANVTGSNIANILLVLGLAALVSPIHVDRTLMRREVPAALGLQILVPILFLDKVLGRFDGILLVAAGVAYNGWLIGDAWRRRGTPSEAEQEELDAVGRASGGLRWHLFLLVSGLGTLLVGAHWFVEGAVVLAERLGMSDRAIGLTVVAVGTSAPEVATSMVSAYRGHSDLATGNALGSNILNISIVLGITAIIFPIRLVDPAAFIDMGVAVVVAALLVPMVVRDQVISRVEGAIMSALYIGYVAAIT